MEESLARSLLRPLGHNDEGVNDIQLEALWELAQARSERVPLLFVEEALKVGESIRRLRNRRELALHAAVGLDSQRRRKVEEMLRARLHDVQSTEAIREDCALIGAALAGQCRPSATSTTSVLFDDLLDPSESSRRGYLIARAFGDNGTPTASIASLVTLFEAVQPLPSRFSTQQLVEFLKMPICVGSARRLVLDQLGQLHKRSFADQWDFVDFAEKNLPDIDLKSPSKRRVQ